MILIQKAKKPKNVIIKYPGGIPTYYGDCPLCGLQCKALPIDKYLAQGKTVYQSMSFCLRCGTPIDWTEVISEDELGEL